MLSFMSLYYPSYIIGGTEKHCVSYYHKMLITMRGRFKIVLQGSVSMIRVKKPMCW